MSWEETCERCGRCCYRLIETTEGYQRSTEFHCYYFDPDTKLCKVYPNRFRYAPNCRELFEAAMPMYEQSGFLPKDCAYIRKRKT